MNQIKIANQKNNSSFIVNSNVKNGNKLLKNVELDEEEIARHYNKGETS